MSAVAPTLMTAEQLLARGGQERCELIFGELVMMSPAGLEHGVVTMRIGRMLGGFVDDLNLGVVPAAETGYKLQSNPDLVRAPDVSFIRRQRLGDKLAQGYFEGAPDLAVEVISPQDRLGEVAEKASMWLAHGATACWVADPKTMTITIYRTGRPPERFSADQELRDEAFLPGFVLPLGRVFKQP